MKGSPTQTLSPTDTLPSVHLLHTIEGKGGLFQQCPKPARQTRAVWVRVRCWGKGVPLVGSNSTIICGSIQLQIEAPISPSCHSHPPASPTPTSLLLPNQKKQGHHECLHYSACVCVRVRVCWGGGGVDGQDMIYRKVFGGHVLTQHAGLSVGEPSPSVTE